MHLAGVVELVNNDQSRDFAIDCTALARIEAGGFSPGALSEGLLNKDWVVMVALSPLFIDKIALTMPVQSQALQHRVTERLEDCAENGIIVSAPPYSDLLTRYHFAYTVPLAGGRNATIQVVPRAERMNFLRLEFNPNNRGRAEEHPFSLIMSLLCSAWPDFTDALESARLNRLDFAVDIHGVHIDRLGIYHNTRSAFSKQFERGGHTTGIYLGKRTSNRQVVVYDKKREARECHNLILRGERTRVEFRVTDIGSLSALTDMLNPFSSFTLLLYPPCDRTEHDRIFFLDSCRYRGAQAALHLIQNRRTRAAYRAWLSETCSASWWRPEAIWDQRMDALQRAFGGG